MEDWGFSFKCVLMNNFALFMKEWGLFVLGQLFCCAGGFSPLTSVTVVSNLCIYISLR